MAVFASEQTSVLRAAIVHPISTHTDKVSTDLINDLRHQTKGDSQ